MSSIGIMHELSATVLHMQLVLEGKMDTQDAYQRTATAESSLSASESEIQNDQAALAQLEDRVGELSNLV